MGRRWSVKEENALTEVKRRLKDQLANRPQFPEVVGDRRLMRFLRGKALNIDESTKMISAFLKWRDANNVDDIRQDIVYGGKDTPFKFPFGKTIIDLAPQIIISSHALDRKGRPLAMEMFDFSPKDVLDAISISDYLVFLTYSLEYRALVLEQMSHEREEKYLAEHPNPADREDGYGVVILDYTIRDLKGVGLAHLSSKGRALVGAALELGLPNYQEYLGKCIMINTPWVFNTFWYFVKGFLDEETIAKIDLCGSNYMNKLLEDISTENIPERLGGSFKLYNEPFTFDVSVGGPLHCPDAPSGNGSNGNTGGNTGGHRGHGDSSGSGVVHSTPDGSRRSAAGKRRKPELMIDTAMPQRPPSLALSTSPDRSIDEYRSPAVPTYASVVSNRSDEQLHRHSGGTARPFSTSTSTSSTTAISSPSASPSQQQVDLERQPTAVKERWLITCAACGVWSEFCEFWESLFLLLTQYPMKTIAISAVISALLYLRMEGTLHLMVFPVLLISCMVYFELLR